MKSRCHKTLVLINAAVFMAGCAGGVSTAVKEENKAPANRYDGNYVATVDHPGGRQSMGNNWYNNCGARNFNAPFTVVDRQATWRWDKDTSVQAFVDSDGRFRLEHALGDVATTSRGTLSNNSVTFILQGILSDDNMVGRLVYGMGKFNGRGCSYPVSYRPAS